MIFVHGPRDHDFTLNINIKYFHSDPESPLVLYIHRPNVIEKFYFVLVLCIKLMAIQGLLSFIKGQKIKIINLSQS